MKLKCDQKRLGIGLSVVGKAVNPNNTLPVLNNILLKAEKNKLFLSATNLELAIHCEIDAVVEKEGGLTIPSKVLLSYVPLLKSEELLIENIGSNTMQIKSRGSNIKMKGIPSEEFPILPKLENGKEFTFLIKVIEEAINEIAFSASTNVSRPVLTGIFWKISNGQLKIAATDSYRLSEKTIEFADKVESDFSFIVPSRTAIELSKILPSIESENIFINITKNQISFKAGGIELVSRLIDGNYPDYEKILPKTSKISAKINLEELIMALKKVLVIVKESNNSIKMVFDNNKVQILSDQTQVGEGSAEVDAVFDGGSSTVSLNAQFLLDALTHIKSEFINFGLNDGLSPVILSAEKSGGAVHVIMPLKV